MGTLLTIVAILCFAYWALCLLYAPYLLLQFFYPHLMINYKGPVQSMVDFRKEVFTTGPLHLTLFWMKAFLGFPREVLLKNYLKAAIAINLAYSARVGGQTLNHDEES